MGIIRLFYIRVNYLRGDFCGNTLNSRFVGVISGDDIIGKVVDMKIKN